MIRGDSGAPNRHAKRPGPSPGGAPLRKRASKLYELVCGRCVWPGGGQWAVRDGALFEVLDV